MCACINEGKEEKTERRKYEREKEPSFIGKKENSTKKKKKDEYKKKNKRFVVVTRVCY